MNQVELNKQAKLSEHFKLGELTKTKHVTADKNIPSHEVIENLKRLCWWLEELRYSYNTLYCLQPGEDYETSENVEGIVINSGYPKILHKRFANFVIYYYLCKHKENNNTKKMI